MPDGIINLDKPPGISSAAAVNRVKRLLPRGTKIGHAGTLDPFATGVLVLLVGRATKLCERLMDEPKQYESTVKFGFSTATDDPESPEEPYVRGTGCQPVFETEEHGPAARATAEQVQQVLPQFVGAIQQRPPAFSAMKVDGQRAYKLARGGAEVKLEPRTVHVYGIELLEFAWPFLKLRIECGRGTYIRAIARDLGEALDVGGYLTQLRRTRVGAFTADRAVSLDTLARDDIQPHLQPLPPT